MQGSPPGGSGHAPGCRAIEKSRRKKGQLDAHLGLHDHTRGHASAGRVRPDLDLKRVRASDEKQQQHRESPDMRGE